MGKNWLSTILLALIALAGVVGGAQAQTAAERCLRDSGDAAIASCSEAIATDPKWGQAYLTRGNSWYNKGEYDKAISDYSELIRLAPKDWTGHYARSNAWRKKGDLDNAIADLTEVIMIDAQNPRTYFSRGEAWVTKGEFDKAISDYSNAVRLDPQFMQAFKSRGDVWLKKGNYDKAIADLNEAIRLDPYYEKAKASLRLSLDAKAKQGSAAESAPVQQKQQMAAQPKQQPAISTPALADKRVALILGNSRYKYTPVLDNPPSDAQLLATTLRGVGFQSVMVKTDLTREQTIQSLREFAMIADSADWAVVYYSGHGIEFGGANYIIPIDAQLKADRDVDLEAVSMGQLLNAIEGARRLRLVILDACRDNPFLNQMRRATPSRSLGRGLARIEPEAGTLVVYAAKHGEVALDGDGKNSPFAEALAKRIPQQPALEIRRLFDVVRDDVLASTQRRQQPFSYGSVSGSQDFYFTR